ncbi:MAG: hypothetical protein ACI4C1_06675 [Lachnospiraceae bacterium]
MCNEKCCQCHRHSHCILWVVLLFLLICAIGYCMNNPEMKEMEGTLVENLKGKKTEMCDYLFGGDGDRI